MASRALFRLPLRQRQLFPITYRTFTTTRTALLPRKDSQDRESINTEATEYSKSGTDDGAARQEEAAFDPSNTKPENEKDTAGEGGPGNPLDVSPANQEVSKPRGGQEGGAENSGKNTGGSKTGHGSPKKNRKL